MSELINNRRHRIENLKQIIRHLHDGGRPEDVRMRLAELVQETDPSEVAAMEQELMAEGMGAEEIQSMCDLHAQVLRDIIAQPQTHPSLAPGHPVQTFKRENDAIRELVARIRGTIGDLSRETDGTPAVAPNGKDIASTLGHLREQVNQLMDVDKHYQRKENLLFSFLEKHGVTGPSKVMWGKDDEVRELLGALQQAFKVTDASTEEWTQVMALVAEPALFAVEEMIEKEERILLPMALETLTPEEWGEIWTESPRYGFCLVAPEEGYAPPESVQPERVVEMPRDRAMVFPTGALDREQLLSIFSALPVDLTYVDADDRVAWFSEGQDRIFARSRAIVGRKVQHCHPPKSVDVVERIVEDFRSGRQSVAEFWIQLHGRFVHIRYFAIRGEDGAYRGTLEVTQDVTHIRALEGERRLLQYETPGA